MLCTNLLIQYTGYCINIYTIEKKNSSKENVARSNSVAAQTVMTVISVRNAWGFTCVTGDRAECTLVLTTQHANTVHVAPYHVYKVNYSLAFLLCRISCNCLVNCTTVGNFCYGFLRKFLLKHLHTQEKFDAMQ